MTGTSCDGLDASCVQFSGKDFRVLWSESLPYPRPLRDRVLSLQEAGVRAPIREWLGLHRDLGDWYGASCRKLLARHPRQRPMWIANHGQTLAHFPPKSTLQLGEPASIALATGISVISDFRWGDLCAGGQGAPLVPAFHAELARLIGRSSAQKGDGVAFHNLGGVSNLTYIGKTKGPLAWDTGPANFWMDSIMRDRTGGAKSFDVGGRLSLRGTPDERAIERLLSNAFFSRKPPKSTGRDEFPESSVLGVVRGLSLEDALASATVATARSIARDYVRFILSPGLPLSTIYFCGGGALNPALLECISIELSLMGWQVPVRSTRDIGIDPTKMESCAFAFLGLRALQGLSAGGPWTGAGTDAPGAKITPGKNWQKAVASLRAIIRD